MASTSPLDGLVRAALAHVRKPTDSGGFARLADAFVTSRAGFRALLDGNYRITPDGSEWDTSRLADDLAAALVRGGIPADAAAESAGLTATRAVGVGTVVTLSDGSERRERLAELAKIATVTAGIDPYRPIGVPVTTMRQTQLELGDAFGGVTVRIAEAGRDDAPHLLLIHGHASRIEEYEDLAATLASRFHVRVVDLPGCGYAEKPDVAYSLSYFEQVLERVMDLASVGTSMARTFVAGGGLGGNLALRLAYRDGLRKPEPRIAKVAAWSVAGWGVAKPLLADGAKLLEHAPKFVFEKVAAQQLGEQYAASWPEREAMIELGMRYRNEVYTNHFQKAYFAIAAEQVGTSMLSHASEIRAPVMLLAGELDRGSLDIRAAVEHLASVMGIAPVIVARSGYAIANEKTNELASRLETFFTG